MSEDYTKERKNVQCIKDLKQIKFTGKSWNKFILLLPRILP